MIWDLEKRERKVWDYEKRKGETNIKDWKALEKEREVRLGSMKKKKRMKQELKSKIRDSGTKKQKKKKGWERKEKREID